MTTPTRPADAYSTRASAGSRESGSSNQALSGGMVEIGSGVPTTPDGARGATMPDEMAASLLETATVLELRGNLEAARQQYERALSIAPNDAKVLVSFARFADRHGQGSVAGDLYQRVVDSESSHALLWSEAGLSLARNGRGEAGLAACRKALAAAPENQRFLANLSEAEAAAKHFRNGETLSADFRANPLHGLDRERTAATPISIPATGAPPTTVRPTEQRGSLKLPFSPGSTARQFERPLPPVSSSRRLPEVVETTRDTTAASEDSIESQKAEEASVLEPQATPPNTKDFLPPGAE